MGNFGAWLPGTVSAAVSVIAAIVSTVMWFRARGERREAGRQANLATRAAVESANHLGSIADVHVQQHEGNAARMAAEERDPWQPQFGHNEVTFHNDSSTPKHNVRIEISAAGQPWITDEVAYVGPQRPTPVQRIAPINATMSATIAWHLVERGDDPQRVQVLTW